MDNNHTYHLPVCEEHQIHLSFTLGYRMPKHWRERHVRCAKTNCYQEADYWLVVEVTEEVLGGAPSPLRGKRGHLQNSLELEP